MSTSNVSYDLIWEITRKNTSYLVKRTPYGGAQFSTEPLNATGDYNKTSSGFANSHANGVVATANGIELLTKDNSNFNKPAKAVKVTPFSSKDAIAKKTADDELESAIIKAAALEKVSA